MELAAAYSSFVDRVRTELPKIDTDFGIKLIMHNHKYPKMKPRLRLEIIYEPNINVQRKKEIILARTGKAVEVRENHILILDAFLALQDVEELTRDEQIRTVRGEFLY